MTFSFSYQDNPRRPPVVPEYVSPQRHSMCTRVHNPTCTQSYIYVFLRQLPAVRLLRIALECHFGVRVHNPTYTQSYMFTTLHVHNP